MFERLRGLGGAVYYYQKASYAGADHLLLNHDRRVAHVNARAKITSAVDGAYLSMSMHVLTYRMILVYE